MSRALITGAAGFVGQHLSRYLVRQGLEVHRLSRRPRPPRLRNWHVADLSDLATLKALLREVRPDYVFHLAALLRGASLAEMLAVNVIGSENLLTAIREVQPQARVLVAGSAAEYGLVQAEDLPITENCPLRPLSPYGLSKVGQSLLAAQHWRRYGMSIVRTRTFNLTGPGEPARQVMGAFARQIAEIEAGLRSPELQVGNLTPVRDFLDVRDAVRAYWWVVRNGQAGEVYNVCSGQGVQIKELLHTLLALVETKVEIKQMTIRFTPWDVPIHVGSPARLDSLAGFEPTFSLQESIYALLEECREKIGAEKAQTDR